MRILLCTDLDGTLLPNGHHPESPGARERFASLVNRPEVSLAYASGRHQKLVREAIADYQLPMPDYVIGDVGTSIYGVTNDDWDVCTEWQHKIATDWQGQTRNNLADMLVNIKGLNLQETEKQGSFKVSYYVSLGRDHHALIRMIRNRLKEMNVRAGLIWSVDEVKRIGLLDVIPEQAGKLGAIMFLMQRQNFKTSHTVFAGDSGNDLPVLTSGIQSVLVANASPTVRREALSLAGQKGTLHTLYLAKGGFLNMNGNYSAGILEGLAHFIPEGKRWLQ